MLELAHPLGRIYVPDAPDDLSPLYRLAQDAQIWAADTETTGLNMYARDFRVRIVQVGTADEAWILRPEWHMQAIADMTQADTTYWHNWVYDGLSMEESLGLDFDHTAAVAQDTDIFSRLVDPRPPQKGGVGHKLKDLGERYVMKGVKDARAEVLAEGKRIFGAREFTKENMWRKIPIDNEVYLRYAGQDVFLTARLAVVLGRLIEEKGLQRFVDFEQPLSHRLAQMQRIGTLFDDEWAARAEAEYDEIFERYEAELTKTWGVNQTATYAHTSAKSLKSRFETLGVAWGKFSEKTGEPSLDKSVLQDLTANSRVPEVRGLANAVLQAKQNKHYGDYIRGMRSKLGTDGRLHPNIRPMQAATHRMSISDPPVQQFPRGDNRVRGCLVADSGDRILSADYAQVEFRVGAAVSGDPVMIRKIIDGEDLHKVTATALFGPGFNADQRQAAKPIGFGRLYLGSANGIREQMVTSDTTGYVPSLPAVRRAIKAFDTEYRHYNRWAMRLKAETEKASGRLTTATGRRLIVDLAYAAPNYMIQSTARDLFAAGINAIHRAGLGDMLRLVVHDEVVLSVPHDRTEEVGAAVAEAMSSTFKGVPIEVEWAVKGERWAK